MNEKDCVDLAIEGELKNIEKCLEKIRLLQQGRGLLMMPILDFLMLESGYEKRMATRLYHCLLNTNITKVGQLTQISAIKIQCYRGIGKKCAKYLKARLAEHGLEFKPDEY
jgi:DNA-directed RNA polymerase alpha subunit